MSSQPLFLYGFFVCLLSLNVVSSLAGTGCDCNNVTCSCCATLPHPISYGACANITQNKYNTSELDVTVAVAGKVITNKTITEANPDICGKIPGCKVCIDFDHLMISEDGSCGCADFKYKCLFSGKKHLGEFQIRDCPKTLECSSSSSSSSSSTSSSSSSASSSPSTWSDFSYSTWESETSFFLTGSESSS